MKFQITRFLKTGAIVLGGVAVLIGITRTEAFAQVRAALTKNVDEPWRTPWVTRSQILPGSGCFGTSDCSNYSAVGTVALVFDLPAVPAGKRWVVQSASGGFTEGGSLAHLQIELGSPRPTGLVFDGDKWLFAGPFSGGTGFTSAIMATNLNVVFGPGETPFVRLSGLPNLPGYSVITFSGYLIDATN